MPNFYRDNEDLQFYVERLVDWKSLIEAIEDFENPEAPNDWEEAFSTYKDILDLMGTFAADEIAPRAAAIDKKGCKFEDGEVVMPTEHDEIFEQLRDMGVYGICAPRELGGMNCPALLYLFVSEMMARADVSVTTHFGFHVAPSVSLLSYSMTEGTTEFDERGRVKKTRFEREIRASIAGETWGTMDLTEPGAGSDLAVLRTMAHKDDQGVWRLTGNKIFITSGNGNDHLVLAKTEKKDSLRSLSLFLVPLVIERDGEKIKNAWVEGIEEKIGHHGSATCSIRYDDSEGQLIGNPGDGFKLMLQLMNHARLGVGFEALGLCEAAYRAAKEYAAERVTMGQPIDRHPIIASYLDEMDITIKGIRAMAVEAAIAEETVAYLETKEQRFGTKDLHDAEIKKRIKRLKWRSRHITPLLKYLAAEEAVRFCRLSMQIHGGNGYTVDYAPQRLLRDALVLPVYEGTSQIQALMALKDNLGGITKNPQRFLRRMAAAKLNAVRAIDPLERSFYKLQSLSYSAQQHIMWKVARGKWSDAMSGPLGEAFERFTKDWDPKRDFAHGLLHAENLIKILADVAIAKALLRQAEDHPERRELAEKWIELVEPRVRYNWDKIHSTGDRLLQYLDTQEEVSEQNIA